MTDNITPLLQQYHDGELDGDTLCAVEDHLLQCLPCQAELQSLQGLTSLLRKQATAPVLTAPHQFAAQVLARLPRQQQPRRSPARIAWQLLPILLIGAWAFAQSVLFVATALTIAVQAGLGASVTQWLPPNVGALPMLSFALTPSVPSMDTLAGTALQLITGGGSVEVATFLQLAVLGSIGLLYWSWLASWWALRPRHSLAAPNLSTQHPQKGA